MWVAKTPSKYILISGPLKNLCLLSPPAILTQFILSLVFYKTEPYILGNIFKKTGKFRPDSGKILKKYVFIVLGAGRTQP